MKSYKHAASLYNHVKYECGKAPVFVCQFCSYKAKRKHCLKDHIRGVHGLDPNILGHWTKFLVNIQEEEKRKRNMQLKYLFCKNANTEC